MLKLIDVKHHLQVNVGEFVSRSADGRSGWWIELCEQKSFASDSAFEVESINGRKLHLKEFDGYEFDVMMFEKSEDTSSTKKISCSAK